MQQGSDEWRAARLGKVTASRLGDLLARTKTGYGASRANYMAELIAERLTGVPAQNYINAAMQHGTDTEPQARAAYEFFIGAQVIEIGFVDHPTVPMCGASPDGLIGEEGCVEIKCPNTATHIDTLLGGSIPQKYQDQMQWQMACTNRFWCDFVSFDPRLPATLQFFHAREQRDDNRIVEIRQSIELFLAEMDAKLAKLRSLIP